MSQDHFPKDWFLTKTISKRPRQTQGRLSGSSVAGAAGTDPDRYQQDALGTGYTAETVQGAGTATRFDRSPKVDLIGIGGQFE